MIALLASFFLIATNAQPAEVVATCRAMLPREVTLEGRILLRNRRGIMLAEHDYVLGRTNGVSTLTIDGQEFPPPSTANLSLLGTDLTWSDLALDFLDWKDVSFDAMREGESKNGITCRVLVLKKGERAVRVWVDPKTGALMEAEELKNGESVRRLWGTRIKKFGDRWMANQFEVEALGSRHRTKITVEKLNHESH